MWSWFITRHSDFTSQIPAGFWNKINTSVFSIRFFCFKEFTTQLRKLALDCASSEFYKDGYYDYSIFEKNNIKKIDAEGKKFDPNLHQAMTEIEDDKSETGTILQVIQPGYMLGERLLRPALVGVAKRNNSKNDEKNDKKDKK